MINVIIILAAYLVGAIPTGWILARLYGIEDITKVGSGNIGATNIARTLGIGQFFIVLLIDSVKSFSYLKLIASQCNSEILIVECAIALLLGNSISIFLKGKGGKGIATALGIFCALQPTLIIIVFCVWLCVFIVTKNIGISSVVGLLSLSFFAFLMPLGIEYKMLCLFTSLWGVMRHASNIRRYLGVQKISI